MNSKDIKVTSLARLLDRSSIRHSAWRWLTALVLVHLVVSIVHGAAHSEAHVPLSRAANLFVFGVIVAGPLVGLALAWPAERIGSWVIAITMASALVFEELADPITTTASHRWAISDSAPWRLVVAKQRSERPGVQRSGKR